MIFSCCTDNRRAALAKNGLIRAIDFLEVVDGKHLPSGIDRQRTLMLTLINGMPASPIKATNILITGGESITTIGIDWVGPAKSLPAAASAADLAYFPTLPNAANILVVRLKNYGDYSPYTLALVEDAAAAAQATFPVAETLAGFDPQFSSVTFSFKVDCGPEFDCAPPADLCTSPPVTPPAINYLAKDYLSFKQVMLDRMNQLLSWGATSEADIGIMLAEVVAYAGDQLSYRQDAVTTEAYLNTARSRISLRRHARLVDYFISEGCNARAFVQVAVSTQTFLPRKGTRFYTTAPGMPKSLAPGEGNEQAALDAGVVVFEPMQQAMLFPEHNLMNFYTWGDANCCLPTGATEATLKGHLLNLRVGDVLVFQEMLGPGTGNAADADLRHRCAVRLTAVTTTDASGNALADPLFDATGAVITSAAQKPQLVTEIQWGNEDALPFPVCISAQFTDANEVVHSITDVSVALGNMVLADHGLTMPKVDLGIVPSPSLQFAPNPAADRCAKPKPSYLPVRFNPSLEYRPLTQVVALPIASSPSTPDAVPLSATSPVSLKDGDGLVTLAASANSPAAWPALFGVIASAGAAGTFDLKVVFNPPGGPAGVAAPVVLEKFSGMNLTGGSPQDAATVLADSEFIRVAAPPPGPVPATFAPGVVQLANGAAVQLLDGGMTPFLSVEATAPMNWPPLFGVVSQQQVLKPWRFNLLVEYAPPGGAAGVSAPVLVEQFLNVALSTIEAQVNTAADLISVVSYEGEPNLSLTAAELMETSANDAIPAIRVTSIAPTIGALPVAWTPEPDLLGSGPEDAQFVIEIDSDGTAYLRFGDGTNGKEPVEGDDFSAVYRVGNGLPGNVGANCLVNVWTVVAARPNVLGCTNPLPSMGGVDPETAAQIRRRAPVAYLTQERAITMQDYATVAERNAQIEDAAAQTRWTGSWFTVFVTAEPTDNKTMSPALLKSLTRSVNQFRLAGEAACVEPPQYIPLQIALTVCVDPDSFAMDVKKALEQMLGSCMQPSGQPALFNPKNFRLGQSVYLSSIYAAARKVQGVTRVTATTFEPEGQNTRVYLQQGYIPMGPFQVAMLANDPSLPANGRLTLKMQGGR
jgi:Baseplate J-like protein